jgi:hypothetical protein
VPSSSQARAQVARAPGAVVDREAPAAEVVDVVAPGALEVERLDRPRGEGQAREQEAVDLGAAADRVAELDLDRRVARDLAQRLALGLGHALERHAREGSRLRGERAGEQRHEQPRRDVEPHAIEPNADLDPGKASAWNLRAARDV